MPIETLPPSVSFFSAVIFTGHRLCVHCYALPQRLGVTGSNRIMRGQIENIISISDRSGRPCVLLLLLLLAKEPSRTTTMMITAVPWTDRRHPGSVIQSRQWNAPIRHRHGKLWWWWGGRESSVIRTSRQVHGAVIIHGGDYDYVITLFEGTSSIVRF